MHSCQNSIHCLLLSVVRCHKGALNSRAYRFLSSVAILHWLPVHYDHNSLKTINLLFFAFSVVIPLNRRGIFETLGRMARLNLLNATGTRRLNTNNGGKL